MKRAAALTYAKDQAHRFLADLKDFLAIPSVSARPEHADVGQHPPPHSQQTQQSGSPAPHPQAVTSHHRRAYADEAR